MVNTNSSLLPFELNIFTQMVFRDNESLFSLNIVIREVDLFLIIFVVTNFEV